MKIYEHMTRRQDDPFPKSNVGRVLLYDARPAIATEVNEGDYGERVTFVVDGSTVTTTPGLDPRFEWV